MLRHVKEKRADQIQNLKEWIDEVNKKAKVNTVVDEVECNVIAQEIIEEIFNDACGVIEDNEAKRKRQSKNTIDQLFKRMKESQTSEKPAKERGVENRRIVKEKEKNLDEVVMDGMTETISYYDLFH